VGELLRDAPHPVAGLCRRFETLFSSAPFSFLLALCLRSFEALYRVKLLRRSDPGNLRVRFWDYLRGCTLDREVFTTLLLTVLLLASLLLRLIMGLMRGENLFDGDALIFGLSLGFFTFDFLVVSKVLNVFRMII
jgi:hypothetical protein